VHAISEQFGLRGVRHGRGVLGDADKALPIAGFDLFRAELAARNLDITALRFEGREHGFRKADNMSGFRDVFGKDATWFLKTNSPIGEIRLAEIFSIA